MSVGDPGAGNLPAAGDNLLALKALLPYYGILKDKSPEGGNVLTTSVLSALPGQDGGKVIYGTACRLGAERLRREGIVFKQLPYKLRVDAP